MSHPIESFGFTEEQAAEIVGLYNGILWRADQHPNSYRKVLLLALQSPAEMVMDRTTLGRNILPLERDGLVAVEQGSRDRRSKELRVTAAGEARFRAGMKGWVQRSGSLRRRSERTAPPTCELSCTRSPRSSLERRPPGNFLLLAVAACPAPVDLLMTFRPS